MDPAALMDAVAAILAESLPGGAAVHRAALSPLEKDQLPCFVPYLMSLAPRPGQGPGAPVREYDATLRVECRAMGLPMEAALWPLIRHVQRAMLAPPTENALLGGAAMDVEEQDIQFDAFERDRTYCAAALDYRIRIACGLFEEDDAPVLRYFEGEIVN